MPNDREQRKYDLVLLGATGFTGRLVAEHLGLTPTLSWAIAGRNQAKLEALRAQLASKFPHLEALPIIKADTLDSASMEALAAETRVVCTTVGPYDLYGEAVVAACVAKGTDYCDLTGEVPFIRRMIDLYHDEAVASGARIVHCCGFDSIPSDLGVHVVQRESRAKFDAPATKIRFQVKKVRGGFSGGTVASLMNIAKNVKDPAVRRVIAHPYALNPDGLRRGPDRGDAMKPEREAATGQWLGPFLMAPINTRIVRRSHALLGFYAGKDFRYDETQRFGKGLKGLALATGVTAGLTGFLFAASVAPLRRFLETKVLPAPGEGPSQEAIAKGFFKVELVGTTARGETTRVVVRGEGDPGYGATARMLGEAAMSLALDPRDPALLAGGILTPASALGDALVKRLAGQRVTFELKS